VESRTILVVDDNPTLLELVTLALGEERYSVVTASTFAAAHRAMAGQRANLIILDLLLPIDESIEFIERLQGDGRAPPVLVLSAHPFGEDWARACGAAAFVAKPFDLEELRVTVAQLCARRQAPP
jgi:DNA-binding response OmpR family regulator